MCLSMRTTDSKYNVMLILRKLLIASSDQNKIQSLNIYSGPLQQNDSSDRHSPADLLELFKEVTKLRVIKIK